LSNASRPETFGMALVTRLFRRMHFEQVSYTKIENYC